MPKITAKQFNDAKKWSDWGDRLGWAFRHCEIGTDKSEPYAVFGVPNKKGEMVDEKVTLVMRHALQRQDKPEPSNVASIKVPA